MRAASALVAACLVLAACAPPMSRDGAPPNAAGLVPLPCQAASPRPVNDGFCHGRNYVTPKARQVILDAAAAMAGRYPGFVLWYMDASGPDGRRPFPPHLSHGDGREVDLALAYDGKGGVPLARPPTASGYFANISPRPGDPLPCKGKLAPMRVADPPANVAWKLDEARTRDLALTLVRDPRVRRIFLEPHLKLRLGLGAEPKIRFQGCWAARHDDHIHVDVS